MKTFKIHHLAAVIAVYILLSAAIASNPATALAGSSNMGQLHASVADPSNCSYVAHFVADVTIPDYSTLAPGAAFTKIWRIRNDGTCSWGSAGYRLHSLVFVSETQFADSGGVPLPPRVDPGQEIEIAIPMVAPIHAGEYRSEWKLQLDNGSLVGFGSSGQAPIYTLIVVSGGGTPPPQICSYYVVRYGDWLSLIALRFGLTWQAIAQANNLHNPNFIYVGMRLAIPCRNGSSGSGGSPQRYSSALYHYGVEVPAGWTFQVNASVPAGSGSNPEFVTFSAPGSSLPQINVSVLTGAPPFTGFENCDKNLTFRGVPACSLSQPAGQNPAARLLIFQKGSAYFHIALLYEDTGALATWDSFLRSFEFQ